MITKKTSQFEFIALMASLMAMVALSIDALLPALQQIGIDIGMQQANDGQLLITMIFLGLGIGQLFFGPLSDTIGRKNVVYLGFFVFIIASLVCIFSQNIEMMLFGRVFQGIGLSAARTVSISIIRDSYSGDHMAKIMSFVTVIFLIVPTIAPAVGKFILDVYSWKAIFYIQLIGALIVCFWFGKRQVETLPKDKRIPFTIRTLINGARETFRYKQTIAFTFISGLVTGSFMVYLSASQQVFQLQYGLVDEFPFIFASLAITVGTATFLNGKLVMIYGMEKLLRIALLGFFIASITYVFLFLSTENPPVEILMLFFAIQFFMLGFIFGNTRALIMEPIGHIAGIGAAITGFSGTLFAVPISIFVGRFIGETALPMFIGFTICSGLSLIIYTIHYIVKQRTN
ncbi:MAG: Bcr/CflA family drug resistance efflux transporter [Flavobacteriaceae bacterium]|nr:MAG: Bcr/CflA family drug resistance efflux transporter [Flavobacteriaceae bacterium]